jgi:hypothetical protein
MSGKPRPRASSSSAPWCPGVQHIVGTGPQASGCDLPDPIQDRRTAGQTEASGPASGRGRLGGAASRWIPTADSSTVPQVLAGRDGERRRRRVVADVRRRGCARRHGRAPATVQATERRRAVAPHGFEPEGVGTPMPQSSAHLMAEEGAGQGCMQRWRLGRRGTRRSGAPARRYAGFPRTGSTSCTVLLGPCPSHAVARAVRGRVRSGGEVQVLANATPGEHR